MGSEPSQPLRKHLTIPNLSQQLQKCEELSVRECPIYGTLHRIGYKNLQLEIGKSSALAPQEYSLHHTIHPNILLVPPHILLENYVLPQYEGKKFLLQLMEDICRLEECVDGIGLSWNKIAYHCLDCRWTVVGDCENGMWNYQVVMKDSTGAAVEGIYFSPQLMLAFSKDKLYPKIDVKQSDVFIFAVMLLEIIADRRLQGEVYNFGTFQIKLGPILETLLGIEELYGKEIYELLIKMLELEPEARLTFKQIKQELETIKKSTPECYLSPINTKFNTLTPPPNIKPKFDSFEPSPQIVKNTEEQSRGRSPGAIKKNLPLVDRENGKKSFSPIKPVPSEVSVQADQRSSLICQDRRKRVSGGYKITPNRVKIWEGMEKQRPKVEPFGLRHEYPGQECETGRAQKKSFSKLKTIRF